MPVKTIIAQVAAEDTINWAILTAGAGPNPEVLTMKGDATKKSVEAKTEPDGSLNFGFIVNAVPGTSWKLTLTENGKKEPRYERQGMTDSQYIGRDSGKVNFSSTLS